LPLKQTYWEYYVYAPQYPIDIEKYFNNGFEVDLSNQYSINDKITSYTWKTTDSSILEQGIDYVISNGKKRFFLIPRQIVYIAK